MAELPVLVHELNKAGVDLKRCIVLDADAKAYARLLDESNQSYMAGLTPEKIMQNWMAAYWDPAKVLQMVYQRMVLSGGCLYNIQNAFFARDESTMNAHLEAVCRTSGVIGNDEEDLLQSDEQRRAMLSTLVPDACASAVSAMYDAMAPSAYGKIQEGVTEVDPEHRSSRERTLDDRLDATSWFNTALIREMFPLVPTESIVVRPHKLLVYKDQDYFQTHVDTPVPSDPEGWPRLGTISVLLFNTAVSNADGSVLASWESNDTVELKQFSDYDVTVVPANLCADVSPYAFPPTVFFSGSLPHRVVPRQLLKERKYSNPTTMDVHMPDVSVYRASITFNVYQNPAAAAPTAERDHKYEEHPTPCLLQMCEKLYGMPGLRRVGFLLEGSYTFNQLAAKQFLAADAELVGAAGPGSVVVPVRISSSFTAFPGNVMDSAGFKVTFLLPEHVRDVLVRCGMEDSAFTPQFRDIPGATSEHLKHVMSSPLMIVVGQDQGSEDMIELSSTRVRPCEYTGNEAQAEECARTYQKCMLIPGAMVGPLATDETDRAMTAKRPIKSK